MVNARIIVGIVLSIIILFGVYSFVSLGSVQQSGNSIKVIPTGSSVIEEPHIVEITSDGFFPKIVTIAVGETVTFINKDENGHWPATDIHPTHTVYPGSDIKTCFSGTEEEKSQIFDSCGALQKGETYSFIFNEVGT